MALTECRDSSATHRTGCGAPINGNQAHCVAPAPWSDHPDGLCHATFVTAGTADVHWVRGRHTDPATMSARLRVDERGIWHSAKRREM